MQQDEINFEEQVVALGNKQGTRGNHKEGESRGRVRGILTARDRIACRWVCEQGVMTVDQLWRAVWWNDESRSARYAYDRVKFLTDAGFLIGVRTHYSLRVYFKATKLAQGVASELLGAQSYESIPLASPKLSEVLHADGLTELRLMTLRANKCTSWKTDRVLSLDASFPKERFYGHLPDAIWTSPSGRRVAVEYERTRKGVGRVRQKVEAFGREIVRPDRAFDRVLWIAGPGVAPSLKAAIGSQPNQVLRTLDSFREEMIGHASTIDQETRVIREALESAPDSFSPSKISMEESKELG